MAATQASPLRVLRHKPILTLLLALFAIACVVVSHRAPRLDVLARLRPGRDADGSLTERAACASLRRSPVPFAKCGRAGLARNPATKQCTTGKAMMMGQFHQDYYLYVTHFQYLLRRGVYVDVAAHEPMEFSNTWFFDSCLGWVGLCVDANPYYAALLAERRTCKVSDRCLTDAAGAGKETEFVLAQGRGGLTDTNKNLDELAGRLKSMHNGTIRITCTTLQDELQKIGADSTTGSTTKIDYLSLDVEGHELHVLNGIDWTTTTINVLTVEGNDQADDIRKYMAGLGYKEHVYPMSKKANGGPSMSRDQVFTHPDVVWGRPE